MNTAQSQDLDTNNSSTLYNHIDSLDNIKTREFRLCDSISTVAGKNATTTTQLYGDSLYIDKHYRANSISSYISILIIFVIYIVILTLHRKYNSALLRIFSYKDRLERIINMLEINSSKYINWGEFLFYIITSHISALLLAKYYQIKDIPHWAIFATALSILIISSIHTQLMDRSIGYLTNNIAFASSQKIFRKSFYTVTSITISPLCLVATYAPYIPFNSVIWGVSSLFLLALIVYWKMLQVNLSLQNFSFLEFILYLCSAEIMPTLTIIVILYRYFA